MGRKSLWVSCLRYKPQEKGAAAAGLRHIVVPTWALEEAHAFSLCSGLCVSGTLLCRYRPLLEWFVYVDMLLCARLQRCAQKAEADMSGVLFPLCTFETWSLGELEAPMG